MRHPTYSLGLVAVWVLLTSTTDAAEFKRLDGIHRLEKKDAHITAAPELLRRQDDGEGVCGTSLSLCPSSLGGGCCPDGYECASESCYATTRGPATCGTLVGWYACGFVQGGGCCPEGYLCAAGRDCIPPSSTTYSFTPSCPASYNLCPASLNYGCCPEGMGCAINQCYSTEPSTVTSTILRTTTEDGDVVTRTIRSTSVIAPVTPTARLDPDEDTDPAFLKFFPSVVQKESPTAEPEDDDGNGGGGGGLSTGALVGIVVGAVAFLIIIIVAAFIIIRHLNKVVAAVSGSKASSGTGTGPRMREHHRRDSDDIHHHRPRGYSKPTDSEIDTFSVDPSLVTPRLVDNGHPRHAPPTTDLSGTTPSSFAGNYQAVSTANTHGIAGYFDTTFDPVDVSENPSANTNTNTDANAAVATAVPTAEAPPPGRSSSAAHRISADSEGTYAQSHARQWSNVSEESDKVAGGGMVVAPYNPSNRNRMTELEARSIVPELYGSPSAGGLVSPLEDTRRSSAGSSIIGFTASGLPSNVMPQRTTRNGSGGAGVGNNRSENDFAALGIVNEEVMHGFYGPRDQAAGLAADERERPTSKRS